RVQVEVIFFDVLAVVSFVAGEAESAFFEDGIALVPQRDGEAEVLVAVANAAESVLAPAAGSGAGVGVRGKFPRRAARALILGHGAPARLAEIGPPALPVDLALAGLLEAQFFLGHSSILR